MTAIEQPRLDSQGLGGKFLGRKAQILTTESTEDTERLILKIQDVTRSVLVALKIP